MEENKKEVQVNEPIEEEDEGVSKTLRISFETFKEFYNEGGILKKIKQTAIFCLIMVLVLYLFRDKESAGESGYWGNFFKTAGIYCAIIIGTQALANFLTDKITLPKQYKKMELDKIELLVKFNNYGISQTIDGKEVKIPWREIASARETDKSYLFYGINRQGLVFTKENINSEEELYISNLLKTKVYKYKREENKKKN